LWGTNPQWIRTKRQDSGTPIEGETEAEYETFFYQNDHLGTSQQIIDQSGNIVWNQKSTAFGETIVDEASSITNNLRFPGQYEDIEAKMQNNGFRTYRTDTGTYAQYDPIGQVLYRDIAVGHLTAWGGWVDSVIIAQLYRDIPETNHPYAYSDSNAITSFDPYGLTIWVCNRTVTIGPGVGNHAYLWDDTRNKCCGRNKGNDPLTSCNEKGPIGGDACVPVTNSAGYEDSVMRCCQQFANNPTGFPWWFPWISDCHTSTKTCVELLGLIYPNAPGERVSPCKSCWIKPFSPKNPYENYPSPYIIF
jgi:RHS repeat-associated protein